MTKPKPKPKRYAANTGAPPLPLNNLRAAEKRVYENTYQTQPHLKESDRELVARYAVQSVLVTELSREVLENGATSSTAAGGVKRSPAAIALQAAQAAVASLERQLALTDESKRKAGIVYETELADIVALTSRRGKRRGFNGRELKAWTAAEMRRLMGSPETVRPAAYVENGD